MVAISKGKLSIHQLRGCLMFLRMLIFNHSVSVIKIFESLYVIVVWVYLLGMTLNSDNSLLFFDDLMLYCLRNGRASLAATVRRVRCVYAQQ